MPSRLYLITPVVCSTCCNVAVIENSEIYLPSGKTAAPGPATGVSEQSYWVHFKCLHHCTEQNLSAELIVKMAKHTQTIRRQFAHELFECV